MFILYKIAFIYVNLKLTVSGLNLKQSIWLFDKLDNPIVKTDKD